MYKIVGVDGRQYGPVGADEIRRWLAENRVNAQTLAQAEGAPEWKPLGTIPEFASEAKPVPPPVMHPAAVTSRAANKIPAGICGILLGGFGVHKFILGYSGAGGIMLAITLCSLFGGFLTCGLLWPAAGIMHLIGLIEGIIYLCKPDDEFVRIYVDGRKEWF
jgi:TM2 domain-containing membrane protein YozV